MTPLGPLLALGIGDSYGAGFEYANEHLLFNDLSRYLKHPRHGILAGSYTDDTQMSIAIAEALLGDDPWEPLFLARRFVNAFKRDPRPGYASSFYKFLRRIRSAEDFLTEILPHSEKSGGAMRASLIGLLPNIEEVIKKSRIQASITHWTPIGMTGAVVASLMTHYFHYRIGLKEDLGKWFDLYGPTLRINRTMYSWDMPWNGKVKALGYMAPHAAITAIRNFDTLSDILKACVAYGGDVDTVAAIAMPAASRSIEVKQDLPAVLFDTFERGPYGFDFLCEIDQKLLAKYPGAK